MPHARAHHARASASVRASSRGARSTSSSRRRAPRRKSALFATSGSADARPWVDDVERAIPALSNVRFVMCAPQGPANVGAAARVMQNFGIYDLALVDVGPFVLTTTTRSGDATREISDEASEGEGRAPERASEVLGSEARTTPLCEEAMRYACAADWLLADAERCDDAEEALRGCSFVLATTARPRSGTPLMTAREAAERVREEAKRGKVAVLFGNERTGLTNDELSWAHAAVAIPTAGAGKICRKSLKYTGGTGPTSLNLSHAVGILAYEIFMACGGEATNGEILPEKAKLLTVDEKVTLRNEIVAARRTLDVLRSDVGASTSSASADDGDGEDGDDEDDEEIIAREERAFERILAAAPMHRSDAAALFQLSRRVTAMAKGAVVAPRDGENLLDETVVQCVRSLVDENQAVTIKSARNRLRARLGVSLTNREIARAIARAASDL